MHLEWNKIVNEEMIIYFKFLVGWMHHLQWSNMAYKSTFHTSPSFAKHAKFFLCLTTCDENLCLLANDEWEANIIVLGCQ